MPLDPILEGLVRQASKKFDVPVELLEQVILEEKIRRYQPRGERRFLDQKLEQILEEFIK